MCVAVTAANDQEASRIAQKIAALLGSPIVRLAIEGEGIRLTADAPVVLGLYRKPGPLDVPSKSA